MAMRQFLKPMPAPPSDEECRKVVQLAVEERKRMRNKIRRVSLRAARKRRARRRRQLSDRQAEGRGGERLPLRELQRGAGRKNGADILTRRNGR